MAPAMAAYLDHLSLRNRGLTARAVGQALMQFQGWAAAQGLEPLNATTADCERFQAWLVTDYLSPTVKPLARSTCATRLAYLRSWYRWLHARGVIAIDPSRTIGLRVPRSRVVVREHLEVQEVTALIQTQAGIVATTRPGTHTHAEAQRNLAALALTVATGGRIGGMTTLRASDVDLIRSELRVDREKGRMGRVLPVAGWAMAVVKAYLADARPLLLPEPTSPWLLVGQEGVVSRDSLGWALTELVRQTIAANPDLEELPGKTISWHSLRVSFATMLFSNGCPIRSVNELMLHRCLSTTAKYTPIPIDDMLQVWRSAHPRP
jgi:site-specific recombinase XerD